MRPTRAPASISPPCSDRAQTSSTTIISISISPTTARPTPARAASASRRPRRAFCRRPRRPTACRPRRISRSRSTSRVSALANRAVALAPMSLTGPSEGPDGALPPPRRRLRPGPSDSAGGRGAERRSGADVVDRRPRRLSASAGVVGARLRAFAGLRRARQRIAAGDHPPDRFDIGARGLGRQVRPARPVRPRRIFPRAPARARGRPASARRPSGSRRPPATSRSASGNCLESASERPMLVRTPGSPGAIFSASR